MPDTRSSSDEPAVPPGPPDFSDVGGQPIHHPGSDSVPGAGPNPTPLEPDVLPDDPPEPDSTPDAGPNPTPLD